MKRAKLLKWALLASLSGGVVFQSVSCGTMLRQSIIQGAFTWVTGAVGSSLGDGGAFFSDLLLGLLATDTRSGN